MNDHLEFPFLFGGTFIEAREDGSFTLMALDFPSFSEGLSLRRCDLAKASGHSFRFPFLFGGTFIEARLMFRAESAAGYISLPFRRDFH